MNTRFLPTILFLFIATVVLSKNYAPGTVVMLDGEVIECEIGFPIVNANNDNFGAGTKKLSIKINGKKKKHGYSQP